MSKLYRHYKNKPYKLLGTVRHSETLEEMTLYKALYENDLGELWVRPKGMFFEQIEVEGKKQSRFEKLNIEYHQSHQMNDELRFLILSLLQRVFRNYDSKKFDETLKNKSQIWLVTAWLDGRFIGFKLGYAQNNTRFYSWLGAVDPDYQSVGIGQDLLLKQHEWCQKNGFSIIETRTTNEWPNMLILNIRNGFKIVGTLTSKSGQTKILMEKYLNDHI
jgi:ribosomal protein S18 acetylase RimI-like enzyme